MDWEKKFVLPVAMVMALGLALMGGAYVNAQSATSDSAHKTIIQRLVERFGLNESDVQAVFDADRADRQAEMQAKGEEQLTKLVTDGKITEAQKQLIIAKRSEIQTDRKAEPQGDDDSTLTPEQRKSEMEANRAELEAWAKDNGIDVKYLMMGGFGKGMHGGPGGFGGERGDRPTPPTTDSSSVPTQE